MCKNKVFVYKKRSNCLFSNQSKKFIKQHQTMKLLHICILILLVLFVQIEAKRGGKGKGRGKGKGKGKGKWRKNKGGKGKGMIFSLIKDDLMSCKVDDCWPTCFTQGCITCKTACYNQNQDDTEITTNFNNTMVPQKQQAKKARKAFKKCNHNCKKTGVCPKWKNVPKVCKKCVKGCYKKTLETSSSLESFNQSCNTPEKCGSECWGPKWKSKTCRTCVQTKCKEEEEK